MQDLINSLFKKARRDLLYPPIFKVELADIELSEIDFSERWKILISKKAVETLSNHAIMGIFHHQLNHWANIPMMPKQSFLRIIILAISQTRFK